MPWFGKRDYWTAFPSSALPLWLQFVPSAPENVVEAERFKIYLTETGADVRIGNEVRYNCSTLVHDKDRSYIAKVIDNKRAVRAQNKTHKSYYTPVLCGRKFVGVLIGRRPIDKEYLPVIPSSRRIRTSENQRYVAAFESGGSQPE